MLCTIVMEHNQFFILKREIFQTHGIEVSISERFLYVVGAICESDRPNGSLHIRKIVKVKLNINYMFSFTCPNAYKKQSPRVMQHALFVA